MIVTVQVIKDDAPAEAQWYQAARRLCARYAGLAGARAALGPEPLVAPKNRTWWCGVTGVLRRVAEGYRWFRTFPGVSAQQALMLAWAELWAWAYDVRAMYEVDRAAEEDGEWGSVVWTVTLPSWDRDGSDVIFTLGGCDEPMTDRDTRFERAVRYVDASSSPSVSPSSSSTKAM